MDVLKIGPLRVRRVVDAAGKHGENAPLAVVLMHGYGAPGDDLVMMAGELGAPPGSTFYFPEAPLSLADALPFPFMGDARAWWHIDVGRFERAIASGAGAIEKLIREEPEGLAEARAALVATLDALEKEHGVASDRLVLGGFSQGSMLATDIALRTERPLRGLAILSGTLLAADAWLPRMASRSGLSVFQSHGTEDPLLPFAVAERLRGALDEAGLSVRFTSFAGGHGIPPSVMRGLGAWLGELA